MPSKPKTPVKPDTGKPQQPMRDIFVTIMPGVVVKMSVPAAPVQAPTHPDKKPPRTQDSHPSSHP